MRIWLALPSKVTFGLFRAVSPELKGQVLHQDPLRELNCGYDSLDVLRDYYRRADTEDPLSRIQYVDIKTYLTDDILVKVDRASMAHSLEVRAPILDHKLMELAATIPSSLKLRGMNGKYIFKKALKQILPASVLHRRKMGFGVPLAHWFRNDLKELAHSVIFSRNRDALLNESTVKRVWQEHQSGLRDRSTELWTVLMFRLWQQQFMALRSGNAESGSDQIRSIA